EPGQTLTIRCQVSYSLTNYHTSWIRQPAGKALEWMGIIWSSGATDYASNLRSRIEITRDTNKKTVDLRLSESAVYYCARYAQWLIDTVVNVSREAVQKLFKEQK
uniref:Immunoglobulin heavy variable 4-1 n=1 Tax=Poecilia latipinna TaxID=48699 RepID=A0A3B3U7K1_9TELE